MHGPGLPLVTDNDMYGLPRWIQRLEELPWWMWCAREIRVVSKSNTNISLVQGVGLIDMEMGASTEGVEITNNSGRQNSYGNNGRRAWIPRGRRNHNQNPNPNTNGHRVWTPRGSASKSGHNSSAQDLILSMNDIKHLSQSVNHKRSEMEDLELKNRSSS
ncbi:hypothetical protein SUGI_0811970 [Cryptomeria japonica]|nr:hypothetical protein SUGI_0811970 [Cryptomeria japonica]